jgi:hypothetical protein
MMAAMKQGQGAATAAPEPAATDKRDALAQAIKKLGERREHLARAERAREANSWEARSHLWREKDQAEETIRNLPQMLKDYVAALALGEPAEKPPAERDLRDIIVRCERELADAQELEAAQDKLIADLAIWVRFDEDKIRDDALEALRADPVAVSLVEECARAQRTFYYLNRALRQFTKPHGDAAVDRYLQQIGLTVGMPPCPYAEAREALRLSADAPIPTLAEALSRL